jgi:hypothetical protein
VLTFTMAVDPFKQNYLTIKLWGSDTTPGVIYLYVPSEGYNVDNYDEGQVPWLDWQVAGGQAAFPGRFFYETTPVPLAWTQGQTSVSLTLNGAENDERYNNHQIDQLASGQATRPIYSAFTTTDPDFVPNSADATGSAPASTSPTPNTVTTAKVQSVLLAERKSIYGSGGYYNTVTARQVLPTTTGAPAEVVGLDLFTTPASFATSAASAWDAQIGNAKQGPGYTGLPDELLGVLSTSYLLQPPSYDTTDPSYYHSATVLQRIVEAIDGSTYAQGSDGGFPANGSGWVGLTAADGARMPVGTDGFLEGIDVQSLGYTIVSLLNDPALPSGTNFATYLGQSYDANLDGGSVLRATAYERMLFNSINYLRANPGGTSSQNLFQVLGAYADQVALEKLQQLYPNPAYPAQPNMLGLDFAEQVLGLAPTTFRGGYDAHFALTGQGLGKDGNLNEEGSYDQGYGQWFPQLALDMAKFAEEDPGVTTAAEQAAVARIVARAKGTVTTYDQFLSTELWATTTGSTTTYQDVIGPDATISSRNPDEPGTTGFDVDTQFQASNPNTALYTPLAARSAYLQLEYGKTPELFFDNATSNSNLQYLRELTDYEATLNALVNNTPTTPLPAEAAAGNFAWVDVQGGIVSISNNGERVLMNVNYHANMQAVDDVVRLHDTTATIDRIATVYIPYSGATVQSDGNLSGDFNHAWVVRYGPYLVVLNRGTSSYTAKLPAGTGSATDLLTGTAYAMGSTVGVAAGQAVVIYLGTTAVTAAAALRPPPPTSGSAAQIVAGFPTAALANGGSISLAAAVLDSAGIPVTTIPPITWTLQSGIGTVDQTGLYVAPMSGTGTATIVATADGLTSSPITTTVLPFTSNGQDVGTVGVAGSDSYAGGNYTLTGAGAGLGTADGFHFVGTNLTGDLTLTAQVSSTAATGGVTIRASTTATAPFVAVVYTPGTGVQLVSRATVGGSVTTGTAVAAASGTYVRLTRGSGPDGSTYAAYYSTNGTTWTTLGTQTVTLAALPAAAAVGLLATSRSTTASATATFANVSVTRPSNEFPSITSLTVEDHGVNSFYRPVVGDSANGGSTTLTVSARVEQAAVNASPYHFQGVADFYPSSAGTCVLAVTVTNADGLSATQDLTIVDAQVLTSMTFVPPSPALPAAASQQFSLAGTDEYSNAMAVTATPTWTLLSGGGELSSTGLFTAPTTAGLTEVRATVGTVTAVNWIETAAPVTLALSGSAYYLKLDADGVHVDVWANATGTGTISQQAIVAGLSSIVIAGTTGTDTLTIDLSAGDPLPAGGLTFTGNSASPASNALTLIGSTSANDVVVASVGSVVVNGATVTLANAGGATSIPGNGTDALTLSADATLALATPANSTGIAVRRFSTVSIGSGSRLAVAVPTAAANRMLLVVSTLSIAGSMGGWLGRIDLSANDLDLPADALATTDDQLTAGYASGAWTGPGIDSASAAADAAHLTALGVLLNTAAGGGAVYRSFDGQPVAATDVLVKYTFYGDANLDGVVNIADHTDVDAGFISEGRLTGWANGDFDYDDAIDGSDYTLIDNAFNLQSTTTPAAEVVASPPKEAALTPTVDNGKPLPDHAATTRVTADRRPSRASAGASNWLASTASTDDGEDPRRRKRRAAIP